MGKVEICNALLPLKQSQTWTTRKTYDRIKGKIVAQRNETTNTKVMKNGSVKKDHPF